ncbi:MAG: flagellar M-ring protein FliF [Chloroflexi bacterium]|nr:flagellar M-ring protein FliF [Chloroflexota bacterium]
MVGSLPLGGFTDRLQQMAPPIWQRMSATQRMIIGGASVAAAALGIGLMAWAQQPDYQRLYEGLRPEDAAAVVAKLKESRVPYQIADNGSTILVPAHDVYESRLSLAAQGIPTGGRVGFEVFDKNIFGMPEFVQQLNFQRGLEGELERTIGQIAGVQAARVHLVIPKQQLFTEAQKDATASIALTLKPNTKLNAQQVTSIRHLVATSVEGLQTKNITITDSQGGLLQDAALQPDATSAQLEAKRSYERSIEQSLASLLDQTIGIEPSTGQSKASVKVNALMNWDQVEATSETFTPAGTTAQPRSVRDLRETFSGQGAPPEGGVPGSTTNVPPTYAGAAGTGPSDYTRNDVTTNYELSKVIEKRVPAPGTVQRLSVAVMVPDTNAAQLDSIRALVTAAAGISPERGDVVQVAALPLDTSRADAARDALNQQQQFELMLTALKIFGGLLALGLILFGLSRTVGAPGRPTPSTVVWEGERPAPPALAPEPAAVAVGEAAAGAVAATTAPAAPMGLPVPEAELRRMEEERLRQESAAQEEARRAQDAESLQEMARADPERLAEVLQIWLSEDRGR